MSMTKKQRRAIELALDDLVRARDFIMREDVLFCRDTKLAELPERDYENKLGRRIAPICKEIGSQLCLLSNAIRTLSRLLEAMDQPKASLARRLDTGPVDRH